MSTMVSTVLQIEREAEAQLEHARAGAEKILADAKIRRESEAQASAEAIRREIAALEKDAAADRARKVESVNAEGRAALEKVRNIADAAFGKGVQSIFDALAGK